MSSNDTQLNYYEEYNHAPFLNTITLRLLGRDGFIMMIVFIFLVSILLFLTIYLVSAYCCCRWKENKKSKDRNPRFGTVMSPGIAYKSKKSADARSAQLSPTNEDTLQRPRAIYHDGVDGNTMLQEEQVINVQMSDMNLLDEIAVSTTTFYTEGETSGQPGQAEAGISQRQTIDIEGQFDTSLSTDQVEATPILATRSGSKPLHIEHDENDGSMVI